MKHHPVTVLPGNHVISVPEGTVLLSALRQAGLAPDAPCGGQGTCGKCRVLIGGETALACKTTVREAVTVSLPPTGGDRVLTGGIAARTKVAPVCPGTYHAAFDIGTTTVAGYLLDGVTGEELASEGRRNPQQSFGADVISRIQSALSGQREELTAGIRQCMEEMLRSLCRRVGAEPGQIGTVSVVGNSCMQQLFLGMGVENLASVPFAPVLTRGEILPAAEYLPVCARAKLVTVPDIGGYVGGDTVACLLATGQGESDTPVLLVDIGTNGELVLGGRSAMAACSAAAGPALEGANIRFGMRCQSGAIDRVWLEEGAVRCHVVGDGEALGICGTGLVDAVAALLNAGIIDSRGRLCKAYTDFEGDRGFRLRDGVWLTQQDIRQVQLAKGAIAAAISQLMNHLGISGEQIGQVHLAGAFGSAINPESALRMGLLPSQLRGKIRAVGNAAGSGARLLALDGAQLSRAEELIRQVTHLELAATPGFRKVFAQNMGFPKE